MAPVPAVIYAAKSTSDEHGSIPTQIADCQAAIEREARDRTIIGPFFDESASAFKGNRGAGLAKAKAAAEAAANEHGEAELWVQHSDRLARGSGLEAGAADHLGEVFFAMRRVGVRLRSVQDDALIQNPVMATMQGEQNTGYSQRLRAAVTSGKDRQVERGERIGGPVPDGLTLIVQRDNADRVISRRYVRDPKRAPIIEKAFELSEAGHGDSAVAQALNRAGHRTQAQQIKSGPRAGEVVPPKAWSRRRVQDTLTNQHYAGRVVRHRGKPTEEVVPATNIEVLIEPDRFDAMQAQRAGRDRAKAGRELGMKGGAPTLRYALSKLATCARCGSRMYCVTSPYKRKDGSQARRYVCKNVASETGLCDAPKVNAEVADAAIVPHIRHFFDDFASWATAVAEEAGAQRAALEAELADLRAKRQTLADAERPARDRYASALAAGEDSKAEVLLEVVAKMKDDRAVLDASITVKEATLGSLATEAAPSDAMRTYWRELAESIAGRLSDGQGLADVNAELRIALDRVEIDTQPDGKLAMRAFFRRRGTSEPAMRPVLDSDGKILEDEDGIVWEPDPDQPPSFVPDDVLILTGRQARERPSPVAVEASGLTRNHTHEYRRMKPKRPALAASQAYAAGGPRSSSVPSRWSDVPGRATQRGSGWAAKSRACSAFVRKPLTTSSRRPAPRAAAASRSKARATSGRIGLPCRSASGPAYSPSPAGARPAATAATARARPPIRTPPGSRIGSVTMTVARSGSGPGPSCTSAASAPLRRAVARPAARASARYAGVVMRRGEPAGSKARPRRSSSARAVARAARSAARWRAPCAVTPPAIQASATPPLTSARSAPSRSTVACPRSATRARVMPWPAIPRHRGRAPGARRAPAPPRADG